MFAEGPRPPHPPRRRRHAVWGAAAAIALVLHLLVLGGGEAVDALPDAALVHPPPAAVQVRRIDAPVTAPVTAAVDEAPRVVEASPPPPRAARRQVAAAARPMADVHPEVEIQDKLTTVTPSMPAAVALVSPEASSLAAAIEPELVKAVANPTPTPDIDRKLPTYRTVMPPAATLHYDMQRGMWSGSGDLVWRPAAERYELRLEGNVAGLHVLTETSTGPIDAHGLAPLRYTDQRLRRSAIAANFQRDKGLITYSGTTVSFPLPDGAQDRLSWMVQIAAVLNAAPQLAAPGGRIVFFVSGARGDADVWSFRYVGTETVAAAGGRVAAVKFTREPRKAYDHMVEVWLAPAHHHLPVRARLTADSDDSVLELLLRDIRAP